MLKLTIMIMNLHLLKAPVLNETIHDEIPPTSPKNIKTFQEREKIQHDTMPDPESKVSSSANDQAIFSSHIDDFGDILNYHSNISQESWKRALAI
ncbi:hypothetical protein O181_028907 [Austropuccinia psidii MF-1]|uniref:Uncharacterized protein n=1 Tax=Austropuccinia psidii MF-1 TaxID=1389203 RepID=A0A9Q3H318_9BASI|nr:hypothetical protein [Austropuccinia psidii MF-1]